MMQKQLIILKSVCVSGVLLVLLGCASRAPEPSQSYYDPFESIPFNVNAAGAEVDTADNTDIDPKPPRAYGYSTKLYQTSTYAYISKETVESHLEVATSTVPPISGNDTQSNIWERIRKGFELPDYDHKQVQPHRKVYSRNQDYIDRVVTRASPFLYFITEEVKKRDMPMELVLLPVVESAFQPFAYSHGRASGIWQFIPGTGRIYGLDQNWWYDGRRDVIASTKAALNYLQQLHKNLGGDWLLALAAYNAGEGTVRRAIRMNEKKGRPTDFWHLKLPRETRGYVPKLLAISSIVKNPDKHGIKIQAIADEQQIDVVTIDSQIDLALASELAGLEIEQLYYLNPGFNRWATPPNGPHRLVLPLDKADVFSEKLASLPKQDRIQWERYRVKHGDSLIAIARKYHSNPEVLRKVNRLKGNQIRAGKFLVIPVATKSLDNYTLSADQRRKSTQSTERAGHKIIHVVKSGETFWSLSQKYNVSVKRIAKWNGMASRDYLKPGQRLVIWVKETHQVAFHSPLSMAHPANIHRTIHYTVRSGDSLSRISQKFNVTVKQLRQWNNLPAKGLLHPGQRLKLIIDVTKQTEA